MVETLSGKPVSEYVATVIKVPYLVLRSVATDLLFDRLGRVVLQAARYPFRKVIGVEISETLHAIARESIDRNRERLRCPDIELAVEERSLWAPAGSGPCGR